MIRAATLSSCSLALVMLSRLVVMCDPQRPYAPPISPLTCDVTISIFDRLAFTVNCDLNLSILSFALHDDCIMCLSRLFKAVTLGTGTDSVDTAYYLWLNIAKTGTKVR